MGTINHIVRFDAAAARPRYEGEASGYSYFSFVDHTVGSVHIGKGVSILHFLGGQAIDLAGSRAISQTKMTISQRGLVEGVLCDVVCTGRFYDLFEKRDGRWAIVERQPIYEKDRLDPLDPAQMPKFDKAVYESIPSGYRHLGYIQVKRGLPVKRTMPGLRGPEVEALYAKGKAWLAGAKPPQ